MRGKNRGLAWRGSDVSFGDFGLQAIHAVRLTARQLEAGRMAIQRATKRQGQLWIRVFPDKPVTKKPLEVRMGGGKGGKGIEILKVGNLDTASKGETKFAGVQSFTQNEVFIDVQEVRKAETNAQLVAENIATQLERRIAFRRAMKKALQTAMKFGAKGVRIRCAGRLAGAEMGRVETYREGRVPLHTLRADVDFGLAEARTTYGTIGVKVWIFKGEVLQRKARRIPE
jgi:ribosomal protein S3